MDSTRRIEVASRGDARRLLIAEFDQLLERRFRLKNKRCTVIGIVTSFDDSFIHTESVLTAMR